jgi:hypothetical protein
MKTKLGERNNMKNRYSTGQLHKYKSDSGQYKDIEEILDKLKEASYLAEFAVNGTIQEKLPVHTIEKIEKKFSEDRDKIIRRFAKNVKEDTFY